MAAVFCCRWRKDNTEIDFSAEGDHYSLMGGNLVISNPVKEQHVGNYSCLAVNTFGTVISREASVQFGCRWHRCEAQCRLQWCGVQYYQRSSLELQFMRMNRTESAKAAGRHPRWCEWLVFISSLSVQLIKHQSSAFQSVDTLHNPWIWK